MKSVILAVFRKFSGLSAAVCVSTPVLVSCGGGSSSGGNASSESAALIADGGNGAPADGVETSVLLSNAARGTSTNLSKNITSVQRVGGTSSSV